MRWLKYDGSRDWHTWYAWFPVELSYDERRVMVWLEEVERRIDNCQGYYIYSYRNKGQT